MIAHGNGHGDLYVDDEDRLRFLRLLRATLRRHGWLCASYVLLSTHYHTVVWTPAGDLAKGMHWLHGGYARTFNDRHGRRGHVFDLRYFSALVHSDRQLVATARYIALNAYKAGLVKVPEDWPWSSYAFLKGRGAGPELDGIRWVPDVFGPQGLRVFDGLVAEGKEAIDRLRRLSASSGVSDTLEGGRGFAATGRARRSPGTSGPRRLRS